MKSHQKIQPKNSMKTTNKMTKIGLSYYLINPILIVHQN